MRRTKTILLALLCLLLMLAAAGCGENSDPLAIREFIIGDSVGTVEQRGSGADAEYVICITLPLETDYQNCTANITLADGASVSGESPCLKADVGGRMVLDLTREPRDLIVENGGQTRAYLFEIGLSRQGG